MATLADVAAALVPTLLSAVSLATSTHSSILGVAIVDSDDVNHDLSSQLVVGIGLRSPQEAVELARRCDSAAALIVRADIVDADLSAACGQLQLSLFSADPEVAWGRLLGLLESIVNDQAAQQQGTSNRDLYQLANTLAVLVGAPVTIEDPNARLLAFSEHTDDVDPARTATILGHQAPAENVERMRQHGVYRRLHASEKPLWINGRPPDIKPRVAMAIRAGSEILGSIWVATDDPLDAQGEAALINAAATAAMHLLRVRAVADERRGRDHTTMLTLLSGDAGAITESGWLLPEGQSYNIAVLGLAEATPEKERVWAAQRVCDALRAHLSAFARTSLVAEVGTDVVAVIAAPAGKSQTFASLLEDFSRRAASGGLPRVVVGLGRSVADPRDLVRSHRHAQQAMQVLLDHAIAGSIAHIDDVGAHALVRRLVAIAEEDPALGGLSWERLRAHDKSSGTQFAVTVAAWLDCLGNAEVAAARLSVHANTVRHRIDRIRILGLADLTSHHERLALAIHIELARLRGQLTHPSDLSEENHA